MRSIIDGGWKTGVLKLNFDGKFIKEMHKGEGDLHVIGDWQTGARDASFLTADAIS